MKPSLLALVAATSLSPALALAEEPIAHSSLSSESGTGATSSPHEMTTADRRTPLSEEKTMTESETSPSKAGMASAAPEKTSSREQEMKANSSSPEPPREKPIAGYDGKFFVQSKDGLFRLNVGGAVQARFTMTGFENTTDKATGAATGDQWYPAFLIPRTRVVLDGNLFTKAFTYKIQLEIGNGTSALRDAYLDYRFAEQLHVRFGQDFKPFSREQVAGFGVQQFVDRSVVDFEMGSQKGGMGGTGRDIGLLLDNNYKSAKGLEWALGIYNGRGIAPWYTGTDTVNTLAPAAASPVVIDPKGNTVVVNNFTPMRGDRFDPQFVARVGYNNGIKGYSYSDLEGGGFRYGIAVSGMLDADVDGADQHLNDGRAQHDSKARAEVDAIVKYHGFSAYGAYYIGSRQTGADWTTRDWELNAEEAQAGYVIDGLIEPAIRWAQMDEWDKASLGTAHARTRTINDYTAGLNIFFRGHQAKIANDFTVETNDYGDGSSAPLGYEFRTQAQVMF